jgi:hypothetical protein
VKTTFYRLCAGTFLMAAPTLGYSLALDGEGHYGIKAESHRYPDARQQDRDWHQALDQSFRFQGELRLYDQSSFFLEFRLFDDERAAYLGDTAATQDTVYPEYKPYQPKITRAYIRHGFEYGIFEAGRRPRSWGMGLFLDAGDKPFQTGHSVYDGVSLNLNMQSFQSLGVTLGYDKLAETGQALYQGASFKYGPSLKNDDVDQIFLSLLYDSKKDGSAPGLSKKVGIYWAKVLSDDASKGGLGTNMDLVDLYLLGAYGAFSVESEFLLRRGSSSDPAMTRLGGASYEKDDPKKNTANSIGGSGEIKWEFAHSGAPFEEGEFAARGERSHQELFLGYTYAPGDGNGYYDGAAGTAIGKDKRSEKAKAMAFHTNFKPALMLFHGRKEMDYLNRDGVFDSYRVMNANLWKLGYRYESSSIGTFEGAILKAILQEKMPQDVKDYYKTQPTKPVGYYGDDLGLEVDLKYTHTIASGVDIGASAAYLHPGQAFQVEDKTKPSYGMLFESHIAFHF